MYRLGLYCLICLMSFTVLSHAQEGTPFNRTIRIPQLNGQAEVLAILQDRTGYLWFGTSQGLYRFDGTDFKGYTNNYGESGSLVDDVVYSLAEDSEGNIWIGTKSGGISVLDPVMEHFSNHRYDPDNPVPFFNYFISSIYRDHRGGMWVGSQGGGLGRYGPRTDSIVYLQQNKKGNSIGQNYVTKMSEDHNGQLWIGLNGGGLDRLDPSTGRFEHYRFSDADNPTLNFRNNVIRDLYDDGRGNIWLATYGGFNKFNKTNRNFEHYDTDNEPLLKSNSLNSISVADQILHITSYDGHLYRYDLERKRFLSVENVGYNIRTGYTDKDGLLWLGLTNGTIMGITQNFDFPFYKAGGKEDRITSMVESNGKVFCGTAFSGLFGDGNQRIGEDWFSDASILSMVQVSDGSLWIGTNSGGINRYDPDTGKTWTLRFQPGDPGSLSHDTVLDIYQDPWGTIWVGTLSGLGKWMEGTASFSNRGTAQFKDIIRLDENELWAATNIGIAVIDPVTNAFYMKQADVEQNQGSLLHNEVNVLYSPDRDSILIGSKKGLNIFIRSQGKMFNVHEQFDFPYGEIKAIAQDHRQNYWMVSDHGIYQVDLGRGIYRFYDASNGLLANTGISPYIHFEPRTKMLTIGGVGGYYRFVPEPLVKNEKSIPVIVTDIRLFNKSIRDSGMLHSFKTNRPLELSHEQDMISFSYAALDYMNPGKISYRYKLEGSNDAWINTRDRRAVFTNLSPGDYTFKVKSTNSDGVWSDSVTYLPFTIAPPLWATWWAYILYALLGIGTIWFMIKNFIQRERLKDKLQLEQLELQKLKEFSDIKSKFFANISHEFRTPLTLITGPIDELLDSNGDGNTQQGLKIIQRNAQRMKRLIDQLLDYSKLEAKKVEVRNEPCNLFHFLKPIADSFASLAESKQMDYSMDMPSQDEWVFIDTDKVEMIMNNLISNAIKYTPNQGKVRVSAKFDRQDYLGTLTIEVADNGPGLDPKEMENIFERFYRLEKQNDHQGTGIGLALTKELVELLSGEIVVDNAEGGGTVFKLVLPVELMEPPQLLSGTEGKILREEPREDTESHTGETILLVEDNMDLLIHYKGILDNNWRIFEATDGEMGRAMALEHIPDLIISDLMIPTMDGNELCKLLKQDERTAHIPIIMLTAKASQQDRMVGLSHGAIDYITKPFNKKELLLKLRNLLTQRKQMQENIRKELQRLPMESPAVMSDQEKFIWKLKKYIMDHLDDTDMDVNSVGRAMGYGRIQLYRKVLGLTGLPTSDFIRHIRIHRAAELLQKKWGSVSEVAYAVGFNNLSYFTRSFKEIYKLTPSQYAKSKAVR